MCYGKERIQPLCLGELSIALVSVNHIGESREPPMPKLMVSITPTQEQALHRKIRLTGTGSIEQEIRKAVTQYLAGPKQIEASFFKELKRAKPKDLPPLSTIEQRLKKTIRGLDRTMVKLKRSEHRMEALARLDSSAVGRLAYEVFGSADKAYAWFQRSNRALAGKTPFSVLTTASGYKRIEALLRRIDQGVQS